TPICRALPTTIRCLDQSVGISLLSCCSGFLTQDKEGYLWAVTDGPIVRWKPGHSDVYLPKEWASTNGLETAECVVPMPDGSVLVCAHQPGPRGGLQRLFNGQWESVKVPGFDGSKINALSALRDKTGGIWVGTESEGIYHIHGKSFERFG